MKKCSKCGLMKDESEFYKDSSQKSGLTCRCKSCLKEWRTQHLDEITKRRRTHYVKNKSKILSYNKQYVKSNREAVRERSKEWYQENRDRILADKQMKVDYAYSFKRPCEKCGDERLYLIQFHHIDHKEKKFEISKSGSHKLEDIDIELSKCVCLCSNCHDEFHYFYGDNPSNPVECLEEYLGKEAIVKILSEEKKDE